MSLLDLTTDIYVGYEFLIRKRYLFGGLTIGSVGLSMVLSLPRTVSPSVRLAVVSLVLPDHRVRQSVKDINVQCHMFTDT